MTECIIIGAGMGTEDCLTAQARRAILESDTVLASPRLKKQLAPLRADIKGLSFSRLADCAQSCDGTVAILVSGDTGFFSAAKGLYGALKPYGAVRFLCGIGSMQYFCAKIKTGYEDAMLLSLHGRENSILGPVAYNPKVFALTGGENKANTVCEFLTQNDLGRVRVRIGENLGTPEERILDGTAQTLAKESIADLAVMLIENDMAQNPALPLRDQDFARGDAPMTKEEIRWLAAAKMRINPADIVFDIGAGTGSCAMEFARRANRGMVYALEKKETAYRLCVENRIYTKSYNVKVLHTAAPEGFADLPKPDSAFIGGSSRNLREILETLIKMNPAIRIVVTAITLETLQEGKKALEELEFSDIEIVSLSVARGKKAGDYTMMMGQNPIYILSGDGKGEAP